MTPLIVTLMETLSKDEKRKRDVVFVETDPQEPFPDLTMSALKREINKQAKDLETEWDSAIALVDAAFSELDVPKPLAHLTARWEQYTGLLTDAVRSLRETRGMKAKWSKFN